MFTLINAIKKRFLSSVTLSLLDRTVLDAVKEKLRDVEAGLWEQQVHAVNRVYRSPDGREVNLFVMHKGKSDFPSYLCFKEKSEFKIAVVDIFFANGTKLRARVWCVHGHVFSIEYKTSPKTFDQPELAEIQLNCHIEHYPS